MEKQSLLVWETPQLLVIGRGKPEEQVLNGCYFVPADGDIDGYWAENQGAGS